MPTLLLYRIPALPLTLMALALTAVGCAMGPDFAKPAAPATGGFLAGDEAPSSLPAGICEDGNGGACASRVAGQWWTVFASPPLRDLVEGAIASSPTLDAARATLAASEEAVRAARAAFYPQLDLAAAIKRQKSGASFSSSSSSRGSSLFNILSVGPTVSYVPDVFGTTRRRVEEQRALAENQGYQLAAAWLALTGNTVSEAIHLALACDQLTAAGEVVAEDERILAIVSEQKRSGKVAESVVLAAREQLAADRALLPDLLQQRSVARHALAVLQGRLPSEWTPPSLDLAQFEIVGEVPLGIASELVRQRPDILAAEARLHAASARVGIATAQMYPTVTLSASAALESQAGGAVFDAARLGWDIGAGLGIPLFRGGALRAEKKAAAEAYRASLATYRQVVLQAFGQVADTLVALANDADFLAAERELLATADASLAIQRALHESGKSDLPRLLAAERAQRQARQRYARARARRFQDTALLMVALGGSWQQAEAARALPEVGARHSL